MIFQRARYQVEAFHPARPMAPVSIKSRKPIDHEVANLRTQGYVIRHYRAPGLKVHGAQKLEPGPATVPEDKPTAVVAVPAPEPEPTGAPTAHSGASPLVHGVDLSGLPTKRAKFAALVANVPTDDTRPDKKIIGELAPLIELNEGTARRYLADIRRAA
jgi:hypothetical protein